MSIDVYGIAPTSNAGEHFKRNLWEWERLAGLMTALVPELSAKVVYQPNSGRFGLDAVDAAALAARLYDLLADGTVAEYIETTEHHIADLPDVKCEWCGGTGTRTDEVGQKMGMVERHWCNGCDGRGLHQDIRRSGSVSLQDVREFAEFVRSSGGFQIQ